MPKKVQIISKQDVFKQSIFKVEEVRLRHEKYDGSMSDDIIRLNLDRGDSVAGVIHHPDTDLVVMTEQFRYSTFEKGPGWMLEIPAGMIRRGETPQEAMERELLEETGYTLLHTEYISTFYLSPGGTSERIHLFYAQVSAADRVAAGGGIHTEGEDIHTLLIPLPKLHKMLQHHEITDAKTLIGLQWLLLNFSRLQGESS